MPPVVARDRLLAIAASEPTNHHLDLVLRGPLVLSIENLATAEPSTRLVQAHHVLRTYLVRAAHLAVAVPESDATSAAVVRRVRASRERRPPCAASRVRSGVCG